MDNPVSQFEEARKLFHAKLLEGILYTDERGSLSNADGVETLSNKIAKGIAGLLKVETIRERLAGQTSGNKFEEVCADFVRDTFLKLRHLRPGIWSVDQVKGRDSQKIAKFEQYAHLSALNKLAKENPELAAALGNDYTISPDVIVVRETETDESINSEGYLIDGNTANLAALRKTSGGMPILHASISCKWTLRSDRAQNARSEALNLVRNRKGRLPHVVVITAEPMPSRLSSIALGTGDIDCVYHFALYELLETVKELDADVALDLLQIMINGKRLKDISDLPLDLAV